MPRVLVVTTRSMEDYGALAQEWFESNESVVGFETFVVLDRVKAGLALSIVPAYGEGTTAADG